MDSRPFIRYGLKKFSRNNGSKAEVTPPLKQNRDDQKVRITL